MATNPAPGVVSDLCLYCDQHEFKAAQITPESGAWTEFAVRFSHVCKRCGKDHSGLLGFRETRVYVRDSYLEKFEGTDSQTIANRASAKSQDGALQSSVNSACRQAAKAERFRAKIAGYVVRGLRTEALCGNVHWLAICAYQFFSILMILLFVRCNGLSLILLFAQSVLATCGSCLVLSLEVFLFHIPHPTREFHHATCNDVGVFMDVVAVFALYQGLKCIRRLIQTPRYFKRVVQINDSEGCKPIHKEWFEYTDMFRFAPARPLLLCSLLHQRLRGLRPTWNEQRDVMEDPDLDPAPTPASPAPPSAATPSSGVSRDNDLSEPLIQVVTSSDPRGTERGLAGTDGVPPDGIGNTPASGIARTASSDTCVAGSSTDNNLSPAEAPAQASSSVPVVQSEANAFLESVNKEKDKKRPPPDKPEHTHPALDLKDNAALREAVEPGFNDGGVTVVGPTFVDPATHPSTCENVFKGFWSRKYREGAAEIKPLDTEMKADLRVILCKLLGAHYSARTDGGCDWRPMNDDVYAVFSRPRVRAVAAKIFDLIDFKAKKWTAERFYESYFEALAKAWPERMVVQVKQEVYKFKEKLVEEVQADGSVLTYFQLEPKAPRIIINVGPTNQIKSLLLISIFEILLWEHEKYEVVGVSPSPETYTMLSSEEDPMTRGHFFEHIKGMPKPHAMLKVRDTFRALEMEPSEVGHFVEGDGSNWDFSIHPDLMNNLENVVLGWIYDIVIHMNIPGVELMETDMDIRRKKMYKYVFKQKPCDKAAGAEDFVFCVSASRRSGDRATSSANYFVNKVLWTLAYFPAKEAARLLGNRSPDKKLENGSTCSLNTRPHYAIDRWGQRRKFVMFCEGDDMLGLTAAKDIGKTDARKEFIDQFWKRLSFYMEWDEIPEGKGRPLSFAGYRLSNDEKSDTEIKRNVWCAKQQKFRDFHKKHASVGDVMLPDCDRMIQKYNTSTSADVLAAAKRGDMDAMLSCSADKDIAYGHLYGGAPGLVGFFVAAARSKLKEEEYDDPLAKEYHFVVYGGPRESSPTKRELLQQLEERASTAAYDVEAGYIGRLGWEMTTEEYSKFCTVEQRDTCQTALREALPSCWRKK